MNSPALAANLVREVNHMSDPTGICACGCGLPAPISPRTETGRGYKRGLPRRFIKGHNARRPFIIQPTHYQVEDRGYGSPCWVWNGPLQTGYAKRGIRYVHRLSYEQFIGTIPDGLCIDHLCRVRACVNPTHLEAVTTAENVRRGDLSVKLTAEQARAIYLDPRLGTEIANDYAVSTTIVSRIKLRKIWIRATDPLIAEHERSLDV